MFGNLLRMRNWAVRKSQNCTGHGCYLYFNVLFVGVDESKSPPTEFLASKSFVCCEAKCSLRFRTLGGFPYPLHTLLSFLTLGRTLLVASLCWPHACSVQVRHWLTSYARHQAYARCRIWTGRPVWFTGSLPSVMKPPLHGGTICPGNSVVLCREHCWRHTGHVWPNHGHRPVYLLRCPPLRPQRIRSWSLGRITAQIRHWDIAQLFSSLWFELDPPDLLPPPRLASSHVQWISESYRTTTARPSLMDWVFTN